MEFKCPRCNDSFKRKDYLLAHLKRKSECSKTSSDESRQSIIDRITSKEYNDKTYDCEFCAKKFNDPSNKIRHKKTCKKNPVNVQVKKRADGASSSKTDNTNISQNDGASSSNVDITTLAQTDFIRNELERFKLEMMDTIRKDIMRELASTSNPVTNNNTTNTTNSNNTNNINNTVNNTISQTINITLNPFGNENTSHLTKEFLSYCILNPKKGMASLIESIHYNKEFPENHNLRCKSLKQNIFEKFTDDEWRACDASNTLDELIKKGYKILNAHYADNIMTQPDYYDDEQKQRAYERFRFLGDKNCLDYFAVKRELRILVKDRTMYILASPDELNNGVSNDIQDTV